MISTVQLLYKLDQRLNKLATNTHQFIPVEDKILALNEGQNLLIKTKISQNNIYKLGLDAFKKRYADLQFLIEGYEKHELVTDLVDQHLHKYSASLDILTPEMMFYLSSYVLGDKGDCKDQILTSPIPLVKHADLPNLLKNSNYRPSFEWREILSDISSDNISFYSDGTFDIKRAFISYIRYPRKIGFEGYVHFDGSDSKTVDCELPEYMEDELLDNAQMKLALQTDNQIATKAADYGLNHNE